MVINLYETNHTGEKMTQMLLLYVLSPNKPNAGQTNLSSNKSISINFSIKVRKPLQ